MVKIIQKTVLIPVGIHHPLIILLFSQPADQIILRYPVKIVLLILQNGYSERFPIQIIGHAVHSMYQFPVPAVQQEVIIFMALYTEIHIIGMPVPVRIRVMI